MRFSICLLLLASSASADSAYIRQPDLHGDLLVFCAESDLWTAGLDGGAARRITTHVAEESSPRFSPDGKHIAFSALYDGNSDVYVIPTEGGEPQRLTWHPGADEVIGWTPDGQRVLFRSARGDAMGSAHLYSVDLAGGDPEVLPLGWAVYVAIDPESGRWAFTRATRENRPWKRYRGGWSPDIWIGHPERADFVKVTDFAGMDQCPMWHAGRVWFLSDQGGTANLWSIPPEGGDRRQHTRFDRWDIRWPAMAEDGRIVFTLAADIHVFDPRDGSTQRIEIDLPSERVLTRVRYPDAADSITEFDITAAGDRLAVVARGEVFSVPVEKGVTLPVTRGTSARERSVVYDHEGKRILYLTDASGEQELRAIDAWGRGESTLLLPSQRTVWHYQPQPSPDGDWIAFGDSEYGLFVMPAQGGDPQEVDRGTEGELRSYRWSPDGRWLAYEKLLPNGFGSIFVYDTREARTRAVTGPFTNDRSAAWDPEGRYLYFLSDRLLNPLVGELDFNNVEMKNDRVYALLLREDVKNPLLERAGMPPEEEEEEQKEKDDDTEKSEEEDAPDPIEIDFEGLVDRVVELPIAAGRYRGLQATSTHLFYVSFPALGLAEAGDFFTATPLANELKAFGLEKKKALTFVENVQSYALAHEGGKIAIRQPAGIFVVDSAAPPGAALQEGRVDLSDVVVEFDPREEWAQMYFEAWRQMREFYWHTGMSGVDWEAIRDQYAVLLPRLSGRSDLSDLIAEIFGEMNTSHTYVFGGDPGVEVERVPTGLLGADLVRAGEGAYRIERILRGDHPDRVRSPLNVPGVIVRDGEYILAVNRQPISAERPIHAHLEQMAGKEVLLTVAGSAGGEGSREVVVTPMASEGDLRYSDWVRMNREYVAEKTGGKIGYLHVPNMLNAGLIEFNTWFYPQLDKEGMVVDVRWNGGGAYSQMLLERLGRRVLSFHYIRGGATGSYPSRVLNGPFVVLVNHNSGSDGDIFPQAVQLTGLAPVIGSQTWGGVYGICDLRPLVDGGLVTQAQAAWWDPKDGWELENRGVIPDIEVPALPQDVAAGIDRQLDRAIEEVLRLCEEQPPVRPDPLPNTERSRRAYEGELGR